MQCILLNLLAFKLVVNMFLQWVL